MGDRKGKKDRTKEHRQAKAREAKAETRKQDRQQARIPGAV